jgi:2-oxoglutarate ferredoxin oxidoreductase subunit beta
MGIFTYQGDGDIAAIRTAETIHAASGENITIFVNNGVYGMTVVKWLRPRSRVRTTTSPGGRREEGRVSINLSEMLAVAKRQRLH